MSNKSKLTTEFKKLIGSGADETPVYKKSYQGQSIAISEDALTMAIGAPENDLGIGCVFIYTRKTLTSQWVQQSNRIRGSGYLGKSRQGFSLSLSADGNTLAVGAPFDNDGVGAVWMFKRIKETWYQVQEKIFSSPENDYQSFGYSVSLSGDGKTLAVGVPRYLYYFSTSVSGSKPIGATWICCLNNNIWSLQKKLVGIVREGFKSNQGTCVALSYDGLNLGISGIGSSFGDIFVFIKQDASCDAPWTEQAHEEFYHLHADMVTLGKNVTISGDGCTLAFGEYNGFIGVGHTLTFLKESGTWEYNRAYTVGSNTHTPYLSKDGLFLAIGCLSDDKKDFEIIIKAKDKNKDWIDVIEPIHPGVGYDSEYDTYGFPVVMSGNGQCVAIGIYKNSDPMAGTGAVKTYTCSDPEWITKVLPQGLTEVLPQGLTEVLPQGLTKVLPQGLTKVLPLHPTVWDASSLIISPDFIGRPGQGKSIVLSEDGLTMIVGGYMDRDGQGSVWVFTRDVVSTDLWTQRGNKLVPKDSIGRSLFGYSLALSSAGNILIVGGPGDNMDLGAVWVYRKDGSDWNYEAKLVEIFDTDDKDNMDEISLSITLQKKISKYGTSVAVSDNYSQYGIRVATGGPSDNNGYGGVLLFDRSESGWYQTSKIEAVFGGEAAVGASVAISGDGKRLAIGCPQNNSGCVLVYNYMNHWVPDIDKIRDPESINSKQGSSISMNRTGDILAIGGPNANQGIGATWIFKRINKKWEFKTKIVCPGSYTNSVNTYTDSIGKSLQGSSVNISKDGTYLIIGGPGDNNGMGAAWAYKLLDENWTYLEEKYLGDLHAGRSGVGSSVAISIPMDNGNPTIAFGGPLDNEGVGSVWVGSYTGNL